MKPQVITLSVNPHATRPFIISVDQQETDMEDDNSCYIIQLGAQYKMNNKAKNTFLED